MTETEEAATDAQWSQAEADRIFYARGFPLADYEDEGEGHIGERVWLVATEKTAEDNVPSTLPIGSVILTEDEAKALTKQLGMARAKVRTGRDDERDEREARDGLRVVESPAEGTEA